MSRNPSPPGSHECPIQVENEALSHAVVGEVKKAEDHLDTPNKFGA